MTRLPRSISALLPRLTGLSNRDALIAAVLVALGLWGVAAGAETLNYNWQWYRVGRYLYTLKDGVFTPGPLLTGLGVTLQITALSLVLAFIFGLVTAVLRISSSFVGAALARVYLETVRNTPLLIQIFFIYFVLGRILDIDRFTAAVLSLSLFEGAYASEILRSGIASIARGQWEAAQALGMSPYATYRHVILPQAVKRILPPLASQFVALIKDSALVSTIAVVELTQQAQIVIAETFLTFEIWFTVAAVYLVLTVTASRLVAWLEKRMRTERLYSEAPEANGDAAAQAGGSA